MLGLRERELRDLRRSTVTRYDGNDPSEGRRGSWSLSLGQKSLRDFVTVPLVVDEAIIARHVRILVIEMTTSVGVVRGGRSMRPACLNETDIGA